MQSWSPGIPDWKKEIEKKPLINNQVQNKTDGDKCYEREASVTFFTGHGPWLKGLPAWPTSLASLAATNPWTPHA